MTNKKGFKKQPARPSKPNQSVLSEWLDQSKELRTTLPCVAKQDKRQICPLKLHEISLFPSGLAVFWP